MMTNLPAERMQSLLLPNKPVQTGYLLVDAANVDKDSFAHALPMLRCTPASLTNSDPLMPRLVDVAALTGSQQDGLLDVLASELNGQRPPVICAWLECAADVDVLARHIMRFLVGPSATGARVFWRYFDPRVFALAMQHFSDAQAADLLGPVSAWRFPWRQRWWSVQGAGREADPLSGYRAAWPSDSQWASIDNSDVVAWVLARMQDAHGQELLGDTLCLRYQRQADVAVRDGMHRLQLRNQKDLREYALLCLRYGSQFLRHPKLADGWAELANGDVRWCDFIAVLDQQDYKTLNDPLSADAYYQEAYK